MKAHVQVTLEVGTTAGTTEKFVRHVMCDDGQLPSIEIAKIFAALLERFEPGISVEVITKREK